MKLFHTCIPIYTKQYDKYEYRAQLIFHNQVFRVQIYFVFVSKDVFLEIEVVAKYNIRSQCVGIFFILDTNTSTPSL